MTHEDGTIPYSQCKHGTAGLSTASVNGIVYVFRRIMRLMRLSISLYQCKWDQRQLECWYMVQLAKTGC